MKTLTFITLVTLSWFPLHRCGAPRGPDARCPSPAGSVANGRSPEARGQARLAAPQHDFARWEKEIAAYEASDRANPPPKGGGALHRLVDRPALEDARRRLPDHKVINRGFGGSEIVDATHFADRIIFPYQPKQIFLRSGGNDIHGGRLPEQVAADFADFVRVVHDRLPSTEIIYIAVNPAPARWGENDKYRALNKKIRKMALHMPRVSFVDAYDISLTPDGRGRPELFVADRLHFNAHGYKLLAERVRPYLTAPK